MYTEITDETAAGRRGLVLYDGDCQVCCSLAERFRSRLEADGFDLAPLPGPESRVALGIESGHRADAMRVLTQHGRLLEGADGVVLLAASIWWAWPLQIVARLPFGMPLLRRGYRWFAARRHCLGGTCRVTPAYVGGLETTVPTPPLERAKTPLPNGAAWSGRAVQPNAEQPAGVSPRPQPAADWLGWAPLALLLPVALAATAQLPPWIRMWTLAAAIFAGCKWLTWWRATDQLGPVARWRSASYLLAWPGMDALSFLDERDRADKPGGRQWLAALAKTLLGVALLCEGARRLANPLAAGWCGLLGLILLLHFGLFQLLALGWQSAGVRAQPLMMSPLRSRSLSEFWGKRWNSAFRELSHDLIFQPALPYAGRAGATLLAFAVSGLLHDLVISVPAGGGYGLPTAYFLLQGCGVLFERSSAGRMLGIRGGFRGWAFAALFTAGPAYWLFHPPFVTRVALPFLEVLHAL